MAQGDDLLTSEERKKLSEIPATIEGLNLDLARVNAIGGAAYAAYLLGLAPDSAIALVGAVRSRTDDAPIEDVEKLIVAFDLLNSSIPSTKIALDEAQVEASVPDLSHTLELEQMYGVDDDRVLPDEEVVEPPLLESHTHLRQFVDVPTKHVSQFECEKNGEDINAWPTRFLLNIFGTMSAAYGLGTHDAERIADFLVGLRATYTNQGVNFDYKEIFTCWFQNVHRKDIAEKLNKRPEEISAAISSFKNSLLTHITTTERQRLFHEFFENGAKQEVSSQDDSKKIEKDFEHITEDTTSETKDAPGATSYEDVGIIPALTETTDKPAPRPGPPTRYMPTIAALEASKRKGSEEIVHADLFTVLSQLFKVRPGFQSKTLQQFLNLNIKEAAEIGGKAKGDLAHQVNQLLEAKYGSINSALTLLKFEEIEKVAFRNVFGWKIEDGQEKRGEPTLAALYIKDKKDGRNIDEDRRDAVKAVFRKIADAFAEEADALLKK